MKRYIKWLSMLCALACLLGSVSLLAGCGGASGDGTGSADLGGSDVPSDSGMGDSESGQATAADPGTLVIEDSTAAPETVYDLSDNMFSEMPRIDVRTDNGSTEFATRPDMNNKWDYVDCAISVRNCETEYAKSSVDAQIKVRGNYTANYEKKPFRIKFTEKQSMLGLNEGAECKSWVLLADWKDSSMLRNAVAMYLGRAILGSDGYYCSDFCSVELYINGQYWGVYLLVEQQQVNDERVDVFEPAEGYRGTDIGYLVEFDAYYASEPVLQQFVLSGYPALTGQNGTSIGCGQLGYTIKNDIYSTDQKNFIAKYIYNVFNICYRAAYLDRYYTFNEDCTAVIDSDATSAEEAISAVIDVDSLVDMYILQEIACDFDIAWSSFFMSVDMSATGSKKLVFEAPWDFDSAFGLRDACASGRGIYAGNKENPWLLLLIQEDWFMDRVHAKWQEARDAGVFDGALELIQTYTTEYSSYYSRNYTKWHNMGVNIGGELVPQAETFKTHRQAAMYLYSWLSTRFTYLDSVWGK